MARQRKNQKFKNPGLLLIVLLFLLPGVCFSIISGKDTARAWGILPLLSSGGNSTWADWNERTESGWGNEEEREKTYICIFKNPAGNGGETGQCDGLAGADLNITYVSGTIAGATGNPPSRQAGTTLAMNWTEAAIETFFLDNTYTLIYKMKDVASVPIGEERYICQIFGVGSADLITAYINEDEQLRVAVRIGMDYKINDLIQNPIPSSGPVYVAIWSDGTYIRAGWAAKKPTKWSDFDENGRATVTDANTFTGFETTLNILGLNAADKGTNAKHFYIVASKECLIDNDS